MALFVKRQFVITVAEAQNMQNPIISRGATEERFDSQVALAEATGGKLVIATGSVDEQLPLGAGIATGRFFYIESDVDLEVKIDDTANTAMVVKVPASEKLARLAMDIEFAALYLSVPGTADANIVYAVIGA